VGVYHFVVVLALEHDTLAAAGIGKAISAVWCMLSLMPYSVTYLESADALRSSVALYMECDDHNALLARPGRQVASGCRTYQGRCWVNAVIGSKI
jgi:hypothetical protein